METAAARLDTWDPDSPGDALRDFARAALARLAPKLATEALVADERSEAPYECTVHRRRWGTMAAETHSSFRLAGIASSSIFIRFVSKTPPAATLFAWSPHIGI